MSVAFTPLISAEWSRKGKETTARLGLDPDTFEVTSPHLRTKIEKAAASFCKATNDTTSKTVEEMTEAVRRELAIGMVEQGEGLRELTKRINGVFENAERWRAERIAATESSRAYHAAQEQADIDSGVVAGIELLLSSGACPLCRKIATECKAVKLGTPFAIIGHNPDYSTIRYPPLHPGCQCTYIEIFLPEYGGPTDVKWGHTLDQPKIIDGSYVPPKGKVIPKPEPKKINPVVPTSVLPEIWGATPEIRKAMELQREENKKIQGFDKDDPNHIADGLQIDQRIKRYLVGDAKVAEIISVAEKNELERDSLNKKCIDLRGHARALLDIQQDIIDKNGSSFITDPEVRKMIALIQKDIDKIEDEVKLIMDKREILRTDLLNDVSNIISANKGTKFIDENPSPGMHNGRTMVQAVQGDTRKNVDKARSFLGKVTEKGKQNDIKMIIGESSNTRAFYRGEHGGLTGFINIEKGQDMETVVHEYGHAIDDQFRTKSGDKLGYISKDFLKYRVGNETLVDMGKFSQGMKGEYGRKDKFEDTFGEIGAYYVGKDYALHNSEITSMGLQMLVDQPLHFAKTDPEYLKFILGLLDGSLR